MPKPQNLPAGEWWAVPRGTNTQAGDLSGIFAAIMSAWSGSCVDTLRRDILFFGEGHLDGAHNVVLAFNLDSLTFRIKCAASPVLANNDSETNADGSPAARHTYQGLNYHAGLDAVIMFSGYLAGGGGVKSSATWKFDCSTESPSSSAPTAWTRLDDAPTIAPNPTPEPNVHMAFNAANGKYYSQHGRGFTSFDPTLGAGSQWTELTNFEGPVVSDDPCVVAPLSPAQILWASVGDSGEMFGRRLDTNAYIGTETTGLPASGDINILDVAHPGVEWDAGLQKVIMWGGLATGGADRRDTYRLDPTTKVITRVAGSGDIPDAPQVNGTFGRWRNLDGCGANWVGLYFLVNSITSDPFFFRASGTPIADAQPPSATPIARRFIGWTV